MRINIKATNMELTPEISAYLNNKLESLEKLVRQKDESAMADVEVGRTTKHHHSGDIFRAEINLHIGQKSFRAVREASNLFGAIDEAKDQMMDELRTNKGKTIRLIRRGGQKIKAAVKGLYWWRK
jgi:ribosomal subunit interface protein